jgi:predicted aspartyl protease
MRALIVTALALTSSHPVYAQAPTPNPATTSEIPTGEDKTLRLTVPVMINGQGPFQFVIDTGADRTVISKELATKLALAEGRMATIHAMGGKGKARLVKVDRLEVSTHVKTNVEVAALSAADLGGDGLLGIDSLKDQRMVIDFPAATIRLEPSIAPEAPKPAATGEQIIVTARSRFGQLVLVDADAEGEKIWVVLDTGSNTSIGNLKLQRLLTQGRKKNRVQQVGITDVLGHKMTADYTYVDHVRIGGIKLHNKAIAFAEAHPFKLFNLSGKPSMLLGLEGLKPFRRVSVDFAKKKVKFLLPDGNGGTPAQ